MKTHRIVFFIFGLAFLSMSFFYSCKKENIEVLKSIPEHEISIFKKNFPCEYEKISIENIQQIVPNKSGTSDQTSIVYIDFSDFESKVKIINVNDPSTFQMVDMVYDPDSKTYTPAVLKSTNGFWCGAACALGTIAIAASDGPAPFMDALAVAYSITCLAACIAE